MKKILILWLTLSGSVPYLRAQEAIYYLPLSYESSVTTEFQNPSLIHLQNEWLLKGTFQGRTGNFSDVYKIWLTGAVKLNEATSKHSSILSGTFINEKENGFIGKTRGHLGYVRKQQLSEDFSLALGTTFGFYNFLLKSSNVVEGASAWAIDGNAGLDMTYKKTSLGFGVAQMFNSSLVLISTRNRLSRYSQLNLKQAFQFNHEFSGAIGGYYFLSREDVNYQGFAQMNYLNKFFLEADYLDNNGLTMTLAFQLQYEQQTNLKLSFSSILLADRLLRNSAARYQIMLSIF